MKIKQIKKKETFDFYAPQSIIVEIYFEHSNLKKPYNKTNYIKRAKWINFFKDKYRNKGEKWWFSLFAEIKNQIESPFHDIISKSKKYRYYLEGYLFKFDHLDSSADIKKNILSLYENIILFNKNHFISNININFQF